MGLTNLEIVCSHPEKTWHQICGESYRLKINSLFRHNGLLPYAALMSMRKMVQGQSPAKIKEILVNGTEDIGSKPVTMKDFNEAMERSTSSVQGADIKKHQAWIKSHGWHWFRNSMLPSRKKIEIKFPENHTVLITKKWPQRAWWSVIKRILWGKEQALG